MPYGSTYTGPGFDSSSPFVSAVGGLLEGAERGYSFITKARDRKKKEDDDAKAETRRTAEETRRQAEFETHQDEAGYTGGTSGADAMSKVAEHASGPGSGVMRGVGMMLAGQMRQNPTTWIKTKKSKDELAQESREGTQREVARVRAEANANLETEREHWRDRNREDQQAATAALEAERARNRADLVATRLLMGGGTTREDKTITRAEKALEFAQTRRDNTMKRTPQQKDYLDDVGEIDVPRFEAAKRGFTSDSTRVEGELTRREAAYNRAIGEKPEPSATPATPPPNAGKQLTQNQHAALQARFDAEAADFQEALRHIKDPVKRDQARAIYEKRVADIARSAGTIP